MSFEEARAGIEEHMLEQADSVGELLEQLRGRIPAVLIDGPGWDMLIERGRTLPVSLATSVFGFELPIHVREPTADLGLPLIEGSLSATHFKKWCRAQPEDSYTPALLRLLREMGREESALQRIAGKKLLLEYDIDPARRGAFPDPGIFLYPDADARSGDSAVRGPGDLSVIADAVTAAVGRAPDAAERRQAERLFRVMPPGTQIGAMGTFPERPRALRIATTGFRTTHALTSFLERTDWPGRPEAVVPFVSELEERGAFARLAAHFDVGPGGVGLPLGVSFYARDTQWLKDIEPWMALIDGLRRQGLAVPEKLSALAESWSGAEIVFGRRGMLLLIRGIHHIKMVLVGDRLEQVKAYVFFLVLPPLPAAAAVTE